MPKEYRTLRGYGEDEFVEKKSRFIGYAQPVGTTEEAEGFIASIRKKNPDARHNVFAYVLRDGLTRRCSDDGEPQGSGGVPVLDVIQKEGLTGVCVVVTRYFGGILLGVGRLARAYGKGARIALDAAGAVTMTNCEVLSIRLPYTLYGKIGYILPQYNIQTLDTTFNEEVELSLLIRADRTAAFSDAVREMSAGSVAVEVVEERFCEML